MSLAPGDMGPPDQDRIPFVALDNAVGWERIASGTLDKAGATPMHWHMPCQWYGLGHLSYGDFVGVVSLCAGLYHVEETCSEDCYRCMNLIGAT